jgi:hypothetical protein
MIDETKLIFELENLLKVSPDSVKSKIQEILKKRRIIMK